MAYESPLFKVGNLPANLEMSNEAVFQFSCVDVGVASGAGVQGQGVGGAACKIALAGKSMLGILQNNPSINDAAEITTHGISKALYGGPVAVGDILMTAAGAGTLAGATVLIKATATNVGVAKALESGVVGQIGTVFLQNHGIQ